MASEPKRGWDRVPPWFTYFVPPGVAIAVALGLITTAVGFFEHHSFLALPVGAFVFMCAAAGLTWMEQYRLLRRPRPDLRIVTGNGPPWDEARYELPSPSPPSMPNVVEALRRLDATGYMPGTFPPDPPKPWTPPPGINHGKKIRVTNVGNATARACRAVVVETFYSNEQLVWQNGWDDPLLLRDLAPGESEYLILGAAFTVPGDCAVRVQVFCDDDRFGSFEKTFILRVEENQYPVLLDS